MRRTRLGDVTGAVTDVGDGGDLEGVPFLPPAPATRLTACEAFATSGLLFLRQILRSIQA